MAAPEPAFTITWNGILVAWQLIGSPIFLAVGYYVRDISRQLKVLNGQVGNMKVWMEAHEKADDGRFEGTQRELDQIQRRCEKALQGRTPSHGGMGDQ